MIGIVKIKLLNNALIAASNRVRLRHNSLVPDGFLVEIRKDRNRWVCISELTGGIANAHRIKKAIEKMVEDVAAQATKKGRTRK